MVKMELEALITDIKRVKSMQNNEVVVNHVVVLKIKKPKYDKDGNLKEGTGDIYITATVGSADKGNMNELVKGTEIGDSVMITIEVVK